MQDTATIRRKMFRYEQMAHKALIDLGKAYEQSAIAIQNNVTLNGSDESMNTYLLNLIVVELDNICDLDASGTRTNLHKGRIGALLCASAEDLLDLRKQHNMPAHPKENDLAYENLYYRRSSLWAREFNARLATQRAKENAKRTKSR